MFLSPSVGVGPNKLVSEIAAKVLDGSGVFDVVRGSEATFLSPLPVGFLPGVGEKRLLALKDWNVRSIGEFGALPSGRLEKVFGPAARLLRERSAGIDNSPVEPPGFELKVMRGRTLETDEIDDYILLGHLHTLIEAGCRELRAMGFLCSRLELKLRYSDGMEEARTAPLTPPTWFDFDVKPVAVQIFYAVFKRRVRVRRIEAVFSKLCPESAQLNLFGEEAGRERARTLIRAIDDIRRSYGFGAVGFASSLPALKSQMEEK